MIVADGQITPIPLRSKVMTLLESDNNDVRRFDDTGPPSGDVQGVISDGAQEREFRRVLFCATATLQTCDGCPEYDTIIDLFF